MLNDNEKEFINKIEKLKKKCKGKMSFDYINRIGSTNNDWYPTDLIIEKDNIFPVKDFDYNRPFITNKEAKEKNIDIIKCFEMCGVLGIRIRREYIDSLKK